MIMACFRRNKQLDDQPSPEPATVDGIVNPMYTPENMVHLSDNRRNENEYSRNDPPYANPATLGATAAHFDVKQNNLRVELPEKNHLYETPKNIMHPPSRPAPEEPRYESPPAPRPVDGAAALDADDKLNHFYASVDNCKNNVYAKPADVNVNVYEDVYKLKEEAKKQEEDV